MEQDSFKIQTSLLITLKKMKPFDPDYGHLRLIEKIGRYGPQWTDELIAMNNEGANWTGNVAAIVRNAPDHRGISISNLSNEDILAVLHAGALGIDSAIAVELAFKDLLFYVDLSDDGCIIDDGRPMSLLAAVTYPEECSPRKALCVVPEVVNFQPEWAADECALLHPSDMGRMMPAPQGALSQHFQDIGFRYRISGALPRRPAAALPVTNREWATARSELMAQQPFDLNARPDLKVRAGAFCEDGSKFLFPYEATIAVAALMRMGFPGCWAASAVLDLKVVAVNVDEPDPHAMALLRSQAFEPVDCLTIDGMDWHIFMADIEHYVATPGCDAWAINAAGVPVDIRPGHGDPTKNLTAKTIYHGWSDTALASSLIRKAA